MSAGIGAWPTIDQTTIVSVRQIAGFWRRLVAFIIDFLILTVICFIIGFFLADYFHYHPRLAVLVGFLIVVPYFAFFSSEEGGGQTLGMRALAIEVVDRDGQQLSIALSSVRSLILLVPLIGGAQLLPHGTPLLIQQIDGYIVTSLGLMLFYFAVFNTATRQSLHDLMSGAFVTDKAPAGPVVTRPFWTGHWKVLVSIVAIGAISGFVVDRYESKLGMNLGNLMRTLDAIRAMPNVDQAGVYYQTNFRGGQTEKGIQAIVRYTDQPEDLEKSAAQIANVVLQSDPDAKSRNFIAIVSDEGFRIGFATFQNKKQVVHTPAEWQEQIDAKPEIKGQP